MHAAVLTEVGTALAAVRKAKSTRSLSMRAEVPHVRITGPADALGRLSRAEGDLRAAGRIAKVNLVEHNGMVTVEWRF